MQPLPSQKGGRGDMKESPKKHATMQLYNNLCFMKGGRGLHGGVSQNPPLKFLEGLLNSLGLVQWSF
eukprot:1880106-Amphidinium_carterae.1